MRRLLIVLFFLSGACGLVYEVVWMRMLTLVFGATSFATGAILAAFFSGLALGSLLFGRVVDRGRSPLRIYALLEIGLGLCAFLMPVVFSGLDEIYVGAARRFELGFYPLSVLRLGLSFLVLLLPATLMGGTLPVLIKFFVTRREQLGAQVGQLYAANTFGAVAGTVLAGFVLILAFGVREASYLAGAVNLAIGSAVFLVTLRAGSRAASLRPEQAPEPEHESHPVHTGSAEGLLASGYGPRLARLALMAAGVSGFSALALEVLWTRALIFYLDNSTHAFSTMLTAFLLGIAAGSLIVARLVDSRTRLLAWLGGVQVLAGVAAVLALPILARTTPVLQSISSASLDPSLAWKWTGMRFLTSLTVMLAPTILMGAILPLAAKLYARELARVGSALGEVYSVNTLGGVLGSVVAGFLLIPLIGVQPSIVLVAGFNVLAGTVLVAAEPSSAPMGRVAGVAASVATFAGLGGYFLTVGAAPLISFYERMESAELLSYDEGVGATVKVFRDVNGNKLLSINGFPVAGTTPGLHDAQKSLAHLPLLLSTVESPRVNVIGFGTGGTSWGITQYDISELETVELVPGVIEAASWFPETNHDLLSNPRFKLIHGDGRNYALTSAKVYDVVSIDATSPKMAGNGSLYSLEFYELNAARLSEDGILAQWLPLHLLSNGEIRMIARTFRTAFPHTTLWLSPLRRHGVLIGTMKPLEIDVESVLAKMERGTILEELGQLYVTGIQDLLSWFVMGEETLGKYVEDAPLHTDNHPILEFTPAMAFFQARQYQAVNLLSMQAARESVLPLLSNLGETPEEASAFAAQVQRHYEATQHSIRGDVLVKLGRGPQADEEYAEAVRDDPDCAEWLNGMRLR